MLQGANTDLFNPLIPRAHHRECQNLLNLFTLQARQKVSVKSSFLFFAQSLAYGTC